MPESLTPEIAKTILSAVDAGFDDQIAFTQELVRHPSLRGREQTAQEAVFAALHARGYAMDRFAIDLDTIRDHPGFSPTTIDYANSVNVVGTHMPAAGGGRSLILNGHIDVVPEGPVDMWARNPFDPVIEGDWMYGRGAGDMKAGIAANIYAVDAIRAAGFQPAGTLYQQSVVEEECTGNGALACLMRGYRADAALIPEPTDQTLYRANVGVVWFSVRVTGRPVHVQDAGAGANAIEAGYEIIRALRALEADLNTEDRPAVFADHPHPINLNIGKIAGGDWASSVPAWCEMDFRLSLYPGQDPAELAKRVEGVVAAACRDHPYLSNSPAAITWNGFFARGYELPEGTDAEAALASAHKAVGGAALSTPPSTAYLDARVFMLYDDCPALVYGPRSEAIHGFDERVSLTSIREVTKTIALFIANWCGLERP